MPKTNKKEPKLKKFMVLRDDCKPYWEEGETSLDVLKKYQRDFVLNEDEEIEILEVVSWELFTTVKADVTFKKEDEWKK